MTLVIESDYQFEVSYLNQDCLEFHSSQGQRKLIQLPHSIKYPPNYFPRKDGFVQVLRLRAFSSEHSEICLDRSKNYTMSLATGKWMKSDLIRQPFELCCGKCQALLVSSKNCKKINDMPSEYWAELMDYWHCHKPPVAEDGTSFYDRYSKLSPLVGELLVGESFFLASANWLNCCCKTSADLIRCMKCEGILGKLNKDGLFRIQKWSVLLRTHDKIEQFPAEYSIISSIMNLLNSNGSRYFLLKGEGGIRVVLWIFAVGIRVTLSEYRPESDSIKVFYIKSLNSEDVKYDIGSQNFEELTIDDAILKNFIEQLEEKNSQLPSPTQEMNSWKLSYLTCL